MNNGYGFGKTVSLPFAQACERTIAELAREGFGVLTDIDLAATMKKKLGLDLPPHRILGACNPPIAAQAIAAEPAIGLLMPCNVVVREDTAGAVHVEFQDPAPLFGLVGRAEIEPLARDVRARLQRVMDAV